MNRRRNVTLVAGLILCGLLVVMAAAPSVLAPGDPHQSRFVWRDPDTGQRLYPPHRPSSHHPLGTDVAGRDLYTRVIWGARFTLSMALVIAGARFAIALVLGMIAGWRGGVFGWLVRQCSVVTAGLPLILLAFVLLQSFTRAMPDSADKPFTFACVLILLGWPRLAEQVRVLVTGCKAMPHLESAVAAGAGGGRIVTRHVLPVISRQLIALFAVEVAFSLIVMGQLGVLGVYPGGPFEIEDAVGDIVKIERLPEWGQMLATGRQSLGRHPWVPIVPGTAFAVAVFGFNMLAEGVRRRRMD